MWFVSSKRMKLAAKEKYYLLLCVATLSYLRTSCCTDRERNDGKKSEASSSSRTIAWSLRLGPRPPGAMETKDWSFSTWDSIHSLDISFCTLLIIAVFLPPSRGWSIFTVKVDIVFSGQVMVLEIHQIRMKLVGLVCYDVHFESW